MDRDRELSRLMEAHSARVFGLCLRLTRDWFAAEDLAQETFLSAWQALERFDGANEAAWLSKIATRKCLDYLRSANVRRTQAQEGNILQLFPAAPARETENVFFEEHFDQSLRGACEALKEPYRETALGYYCEGRTHAEIAKQSDVPLDTVRTRCYRAKLMLKEILREEVRCEPFEANAIA